MDERAVFERFHEALELEPRAGAYERFRAAFVTVPAAARPRPAFRLRFSKMSLRFAAVAAVIAIAIALVAGFLVTHQHPPTSNVPAHPDASLLAYQERITSDYQQMVDAQSSHCSTIQDQGCAAAIARLNPVLEKWETDLSSLNTPARYAVLDALLRAHLRAAIAYFNAAVAFQQQHNQAGFDLAMGDVLYERGWLDPTSFLLEGIDQSDATSYRSAVALVKQTLSACAQAGGPCAGLAGGIRCVVDGSLQCNNDIQNSETALQVVVMALVQNPAPSSAAASQARTMQNDALHADLALLNVAAAQLQGNAAAVSTAEAAFSASIQAALGDAGVAAPA